MNVVGKKLLVSLSLGLLHALAFQLFFIFNNFTCHVVVT